MEWNLDNNRIGWKSRFSTSGQCTLILWTWFLRTPQVLTLKLVKTCSGSRLSVMLEIMKILYSLLASLLISIVYIAFIRFYVSLEFWSDQLLLYHYPIPTTFTFYHTTFLPAPQSFSRTSNATYGLSSILNFIFFGTLWREAVFECPLCFPLN